jgi:hypothetical protein
MNPLFLAAPPGDDAAAALRRELEALGYTFWQMPEGIAPDMVSYGRAYDDGVLAAPAVIVAWSAATAADEWAERVLLTAQRLRKLIYGVALDATPLPATLGNLPPIAAADALRALKAQLPPPDMASPLDDVAALLSSDLIRKRREGIGKANELLAQAQYRETLLAWLEHLAHTDLMGSMRKLAQDVLAAERARPAPPTPPDESRHMQGVRCPQGHITWFDKRALCADYTTFKRSVVRRADADLSEIYVKCATCGAELTIRVDCEAYQ